MILMVVVVLVEAWVAIAPCFFLGARCYGRIFPHLRGKTPWRLCGGFRMQTSHSFSAHQNPQAACLQPQDAYAWQGGVQVASCLYCEVECQRGHSPELKIDGGRPVPVHHIGPDDVFDVWCFAGKGPYRGKFPSSGASAEAVECKGVKSTESALGPAMCRRRSLPQKMQDPVGYSVGALGFADLISRWLKYGAHPQRC